MVSSLCYEVNEGIRKIYLCDTVNGDVFSGTYV